MVSERSPKNPMCHLQENKALYNPGWVVTLKNLFMRRQSNRWLFVYVTKTSKETLVSSTEQSYGAILLSIFETRDAKCLIS